MSEKQPATPRTPAIEPLRDVMARLRGQGVEVALGGSGLLASLGLTDHVRDWDVTTDASVDDVAAALGDTPHERFGNSGIHADHKLVLDGGTIEVICRFALRSDAGVCRVPTRVTGSWHGLPIGSAVAWSVAYALMDRDAKAELLWRHLGGTGVPREERDAIASQPMPDAIRLRVAALPVRD